VQTHVQPTTGTTTDTTTDTTTGTTTFATLKIITGGCPAHRVHNNGVNHNGEKVNAAVYQQYTLEIPLLDVLAPPLLDPIPSFGGPVGVMLDGAFLYNPLTANGKDAVMAETFDHCFGQADELGRYHYHTTPLCLFELLNATHPPRSSWHHLRQLHNASHHAAWLGSWPVTAKEPSPLLGWALDGVPIYGPYDETGTLLKWGGSVPNAMHPNVTSRLDACNGRVRPTDGRYVYHLTPSSPYTVGCFRGGKGLGVSKGRALQKECPG